MTAAELLALWAIRDRRYVLRQRFGHTHPLGTDEMAQIREVRQREVSALPAPERAAAYRAWSTWHPPSVVPLGSKR